VRDGKEKESKEESSEEEQEEKEVERRESRKGGRSRVKTDNQKCERVMR